MSKLYIVLLFTVLAASTATGQQVSDYYRLPDHNKVQYDRLLTRYGGAYINDRWYVALTGFVRADKASLDNTIGGMVGARRVVRPGWGALLGWAYKEKWAVEAGYVQSPAHTSLSVDRGRIVPSLFQYANDQHSFVLRGKRMLLSTSGSWRRSGFWLTAGAWLVPGKGGNRGELSLPEYAYRSREKVDTLRLSGETQLSNAPSVIAELGAEYNVRLSNRFDLGISARKLWGLGSSIDTDLSYTTTSQPTQYAQLRGVGSGMTYGVTLRYSLAINQSLSNVLKTSGSRLGK
jgi:hypothetical protein